MCCAVEIIPSLPHFFEPGHHSAQLFTPEILAILLSLIDDVSVPLLTLMALTAFEKFALTGARLPQTVGVSLQNIILLHRSEQN